MKKNGYFSGFMRLTAVLLLAAVWLAFLPAPTRAEGSSVNRGDRIIVSLGDSFSSGEGNEKFYDQDLPLAQRVRSRDWLAHRSENAWPGKLKLEGVDNTMKENRGTHWFFAAASGATTDHIMGWQEKEYFKFEDGTLYYFKGNLLPPQIRIFDEVDKLGKTVDYVTLTLGGNDLGFDEIIKACVFSGKIGNYLQFGKVYELLLKARTLYETGEEGKASVRDRLRDAYRDIARRAPNARIIVAGYPTLLDERGFFINKSEAKSINSSIRWFNREISELIGDCREEGMKISFVPVDQKGAFLGHEAYSDIPYIEEICILTKEQDLKDIKAGSSYSMHPIDDEERKAEGLKTYARCVQKEIDYWEARWDAWHAPAATKDPVQSSPEPGGTEETRINASDLVLFGSAVIREDDSIQLTPPETWKSGSAWLPDKIDTGGGFEVSFSFWAGGGRGDSYGGADGIVCAFSGEMGLGGNGEYLGFVSEGVYGVEFDSYRGNPGDPSGKHIAIIQNKVSQHLTYELTDIVDDSQWHDVVILYNENRLTVFVDNQYIVSQKSVILPESVCIGLSAATGGGYNEHIVRDLIVR